MVIWVELWPFQISSVVAVASHPVVFVLEMVVHHRQQEPSVLSLSQSMADQLVLGPSVVIGIAYRHAVFQWRFFCSSS